MMPIKISCGCGQRYSFDIEPINGRMPSTVACPVCGADGTAVANSIIAQSAPTHEVPVARLIEPVTASAAADPVVAAPRTAPVRVATPTSSPESAPVRVASSAPTIAHHAPAAPRPVPRRLPGQLDYDTARNEARAKMLWGDPPQAVLSFIMMQGIGRAEAQEIVDELLDERAKTVRANGFRKIFTGIGCILVPIATLVGFLMIGVIQTQILAVTIMVGVYGIWLLLNGIIKVVAPRFEKGDASE